MTALDSGLQSLDLLVNTIGNYSGTVLLPEGTASLEIKADGQWQGEIKPLFFERGPLMATAQEVEATTC